VFTYAVDACFTFECDGWYGVLVVAKVAVVSRFVRRCKRRYNGFHHSILNGRNLPALHRYVGREGGENRLQRVAVAIEIGSGIVALASIGGCRIEVAGHHVLTPDNLEGIAHPVAVLVHQAIAVTIVSKLGEFTRIVRVQRSLVVVARRGLKTAGTRFEFTRSVVVGRFCIEVARLRVCTAAHWLLARTVVVGGQWVVVQGCGRSASCNLVAVAHVISIGILQAIAFTVSSFLWEDTCAVVHLSFWIVVARLQHRAARRQTRHEVA